MTNINSDTILPKCKVITIASERTDGLKLLLNSAKCYGIKVEIIGLGVKWPNNTKKIDLLVNFFKKNIKEDLVLFIDGYDSLFVCDLNKIIKKFINFKSDFVMSADSNKWPDNLPNYGDCNKTNRYVNSGGWIGYKDKIQLLLKQISSYKPILGSDQSVWAQYYMEKPFSIDHDCEIFNCLNRAPFINRKTCILHSNNQSSFPPNFNNII